MYPDTSEKPKFLIKKIGKKLTINITLVACGIRTFLSSLFFPNSNNAAEIGTNAPGRAAKIDINLPNLHTL